LGGNVTVPGFLGKVLWRGGFIFFLLAIAGAIYIGSQEIYLYATRSDAKAQLAAEKMFLEICHREEIEASQFSGPETIGAYSYVWKRTPEETISVSVMYLPYDLSYSLSKALIENSWKAKTKTKPCRLAAQPIIPPDLREELRRPVNSNVKSHHAGRVLLLHPSSRTPPRYVRS
jgi:hypothetical protein